MSSFALQLIAVKMGYFHHLLHRASRLTYLRHYCSSITIHRLYSLLTYWLINKVRITTAKWIWRRLYRRHHRRRRPSAVGHLRYLRIHVRLYHQQLTVSYLNFLTACHRLNQLHNKWLSEQVLRYLLPSQAGTCSTVPRHRTLPRKHTFRRYLVSRHWDRYLFRKNTSYNSRWWNRLTTTCLIPRTLKDSDLTCRVICVRRHLITNK